MFKFVITSEDNDPGVKVDAAISGGVTPADLMGALYSLASVIAKYTKKPPRFVVGCLQVVSDKIEANPESYREGECVEMTLPRDFSKN